MAGAEVRAEPERGVIASRAEEVVLVGGRPEDLLVPIGRRDEHAEIRADRQRHAAELGLDDDPAGLGADRRDPAQPFLDRVPDEPGRVGRERERPDPTRAARRRSSRRVTRLLHAAEQDHLQRRQHRATRSSNEPSACCSIVAIMLASGASHSRSRIGRELAVDLGAGRIRDGPLGGVVLEVDRALGKTVEPASQGVAVELAEAEHAPEREHGDRLEVLAHQLGLAPVGDRVEELVDDRRRRARGAVASTTRGRSDGSSMARSFFCGGPSSTRMLGPPITRSSGDGVTDESISSGWDVASSTSAHRVTNQRPTAGTKQTGASRRMRA